MTPDTLVREEAETIIGALEGSHANRVIAAYIDLRVRESTARRNAVGNVSKFLGTAGMVAAVILLGYGFKVWMSADDGLVAYQAQAQEELREVRAEYQTELSEQGALLDAATVENTQLRDKCIDGILTQ